MKKTTNYQLNQWAKTDRILMDDFNADNAKIDETLAAHAAALAAVGKYEVLEERMVTQSINTISFDLSALDWSEWRLIGLRVQIPKNNLATSHFFCVGMTNISASCTHNENHFAFLDLHSFMVVLSPLYNSVGTVKGFYLGGNSGIGYSDAPFSQVKDLYLSGTTPYPLNTKVVLWGIR